MADSNETDAPATAELKKRTTQAESRQAPLQKPTATLASKFVTRSSRRFQNIIPDESADVVGPDGPPEMPRIALVGVHGMGVQLPYDTMDEYAQMLSRYLTVSRTVCEVATLNGSELWRVKLTYDGKKDGSAASHKEVHLFEGYWSPITKGQVKIADAISFLGVTGLNGLNFGLATSGRDRTRFAFNKWWTFPRERWMVLLFPFILAFVGDLVALNSVIGAVSALKFFNAQATSPLVFARESSLWVTAMAILPILGISAVLGISLAVTTNSYRAKLRAVRGGGAPPKSVSAQRFNWFWIYAALTSVIAAPILILLNSTDPFPKSVAYFDWLWNWMQDWNPFWGGLGIVAVIAAAVGISAFIKKYIVDYLGDLTVYLSVNQSTRYYDLRHRVRDAVKTVLQNVYAAKENGDAAKPFVYDEVIVSAHSLGTAVLYDALNDLIADDIRNGNPLNVAARTKLMATCGSPLDKYAYLFRNRQVADHPYREGESQANQPMITSYTHRPKEWVNVWTVQDPISGDLGFYDDFDDPTYETQWVQNFVDTLGVVPFACHSYYFDNIVLGQQISARL